MSTPASERFLALKVILLPRDTNAHGTIFGGVILSHIDLAGAVEARRHTRHRVVTVAMREVEFHEPVYVGDVVSFWTRLVRTGTTSIAVHVSVEAQRASDPATCVQVTEAEVIYVAIDEAGRKRPIADDG
ncbi:MAG: acyl-CoA thioesterase [Planctomycetota bacterium]|nr:MAG: acyl-CoA thioesterase [Planctomycetota bacterium]